MKLKKILLCGNSSWSMYNFRLGVIKFLISNQYSVVILAPRDDYSDKLISIGCKFIDINLSAQGVNPFNELKFLFSLVSIYREEKPDFIINYTIKPNIYGSLASKVTNIPSIAITTGLGFVFTRKSIVSFFAKLLYKIALSCCQEVWFLNSDDQDVFLRKNIVNKNKTKILYSEGIDVTHFSPRKRNDHHDEDTFCFLLVARMLRDKGVPEFVSAARIIKKKYPNVSFRLLGFCDVENPSAITRSEIDSWVNEGVVEYLGVTDDVRQYIADSQCIVLPSSYREGIPRILMEAASMAKPVITTNNVGCREVILDEVTGYLCEVNNVDSLVSACEKLLSLDEAQIIDMGKKGRKLVEEKFSEEKIISQYSE
ncbi:glycosyltransferase family 4 protein, partial [Yersinia pseudotuberculosis]